MTLDPRQPNQLSIEPLQPVHEHWSVGLVQHVFADLDVIVGPNSDQVCVERGVVQGAQRDAVCHRRRAAFVAIADNVCDLEKLVTLEPAHGAMAEKRRHRRPEHQLPQQERTVQQAQLELPGKVPYNGGQVATRTLEDFCPNLPSSSPPPDNSRAC